MTVSETQSPSIFSQGLAASEKRIGSIAVRSLCGDVSDMTLHRWLKSPVLNFPKPIYIGQRRYWKESEIVAWLNAQAQDQEARA
ncbi:transcriptional regulator [Sinirhodobacter populi]|uniref:Transcriptional regulator n=1 Tax=Paenirhodobacter populi TaxID=2306993 RepID=A0A443K9N5_9RHOB|nr:transcriptional regulator [Sinirhodobacter populi]RWR29474.1 transcriptional regulator [Sinirhodobacter populi]